MYFLKHISHIFIYMCVFAVPVALLTKLGDYASSTSLCFILAFFAAMLNEIINKLPDKTS